MENQQALNKVTLPFEWMEKGQRCSYSKVTNKKCECYRPVSLLPIRK